MAEINVIGDRIRHYRKMNRLTQRELASELGVAPKYISNIEEGNKKPSLEMLLEICKWFNISVSELLPMSGQQNIETKEQWINEIMDILREFDTDRVALVKTMVRCMKA